MAQTFDILPSGDVENDGWTIVASSATTVWEVLSAPLDDNCYVRCPSYRGGAECSFPVDVTDLPDGAIIDSITVFCRIKTSAGSGPRSVTCNVLSSDNRSRYTQRTIYATSVATTFEVGTYTKDPLGRAWDIHRLNKLRCRFFCLNNLFDSCRVYSMYCRVNYHVRPTVTVTSPTGTVSTPSPTIAWTYAQTEGEPQKGAEYKIFATADTTSPTFSPDTATPIYSKSVTGLANSYVLPTSLNANSYRVYVRVQSVHGAWSTWAYKQFTISAVAPGVPGDNNAGVSGVPGVGTPTVVPDNYTSSTAIRMVDTSNLLSVNQADFEIATDPIGWNATTNCTVARDTGKAFGDGLASLMITASSAATVKTAATYVEVAPSQPMTLRAQLLAGATGRTVTLGVDFYDESYTLLAGGWTATPTADVTTTWTEIVGTGTSPAGAKYAEPYVSIASPANAEKHYLDHVGLMYGTNTAWSDGGHASRNLLTAFLATGDDPAPSSDAWTQANAATTVTRVTATGTGAHGAKCNQMTYAGVSPSIAFRATGTVFTTPTAGTNFTLNKPAGLADNDLMIAFVTSTEFGTINPPAGWTAVNTAAVDDGTTDIALWILKRTGLAADPSTWTTGTVSASSSRRTAVVVAYSGAAHSDSQFVAEAVRTETAEPLVHQTATVNNTDPNAWRVAAFAASDDHTGMSMVANLTPPTTAAGIAYVGKATAWSTSSRNTSFTLNKPAGVVNGDVMLASVLFSGIVSSVTTPTGWTLIRKITTAVSGQQDDGYLTSCIYRRNAGSSEPNSWSAAHTDTPTYPKITQVVAYRNVDTTAPIIDEDYGSANNGSSVGTNTVTNTNSNAWRVCFFGALSSTQKSWGSGDVVERADDVISSSYYDATLSVSDSNGKVSTGNHSRTGTLSSGSYSTAFGWIGLLKPLSSPPAAGANETERVDNSNGSSNPWLSTAVYDSNGIAPTGQQSVYGILTTSDGLGSNAMASWIGFIKPASSVQGGTAAAYPNRMIDIGDMDPDVLTLAKNKLTMTAAFLGSAAGTPTLTAEFYRANKLISSQSAPGQAFNTTDWVKSWAVFDVPDGTTRIRPVVSALERATSDTVQFDRVGVMLGALDDPTQEPQWRNGTARSEHTAWSGPVLEYQENNGNGYGDWTLLAGQKLRPPQYSLADGSMFYVDHTIIPLNARRYRASTTSYGLAGDVFSSGFGPTSQEAIFESRAWWLKDIENPENNMQIEVKWGDQQMDTTNMATAFQPLGADYPIVISAGFKGDVFPLEIHCEQGEFVLLMDLLNSGKSLVLQSDIDKMWWVRPVGNISAKILATGSRQERPRRYVTVNFVQVAPEE